MKKSSAAISELARPARAKSDSSQVSPKDQFEGRKSSELVIAFAGPIGSGIKTVVDLTNERLVALGYTVHRIKLSVLIDNAFEKGLIRKSPENTVDRASRYIRLQEGGNDLRGDFGNDILAEWSVREIVGIRSADIPSDLATRHKEFVPGRVAYLVDQIKHPAEVDLFRAVYRNLFYLIGVVSVASSREGRLAQEHVPAGRISDLIERDRKQEEENGQQLDKALQMADFFVRNDRGNLEPVKTHITRFLSLLHGENGVTPTRQEYGMYVAFAAGLKSACMSRQVGAAIANSEGVVIATGCNDVPKPGGGLYTTEDGHNDHRCVHKEQQVCFNDKEKNELRDAMGKSLKSILDKVAPDAATDESLVEKLLTDLYGASKLVWVVQVLPMRFYIPRHSRVIAAPVT